MNNGQLVQAAVTQPFPQPAPFFPPQQNFPQTVAPNPAPAPAPAPVKPVKVDDTAKVWGDPHFVGAEGGRYDIKGNNNAVYNLLSDRGVQVNSTFNNNLMQDYGVTVGQNQISFNKAGKLSINGEEVKGNGEFLNGMVERKGTDVTIKTGEYELKMTTRSSYMDIAIKSDNVAADGVMPHGLWGQSADGDGKARKGTDFDGSGAIEKLDGTMAEKGDKTFELYEVADIFDTNFANFNRFQGNFTAPVVNTAANGAGF